jgi:hypothetical protein
MLILSIETINYDCYPDTVWGTREGNLNNPVYLPKVIVWGRSSEMGRSGRIPHRSAGGISPKNSASIILLSPIRNGTISAARSIFAASIPRIHSPI